MPEMKVYTGPLANASMGSAKAATSVTAGQALVTSLPPSGRGLYRVNVVAYLSAGTPAAADNGNLEFRFGGTALSSIPLVPALNVVTSWETTFTSDGSTNFSVNATGNGTAGVAYNVFFTATKVGD
ncbi:hypothetical protein [Streptomyces sp. NPDC001843]|uniref:hypothetical protein n=1 Tax=Streptomyces sp. NPDC001843 TaxID=3364617 RepID=UPI003687E27E